ncbi:TPA: peptidylprolyl isomerase [Streptococcus pyogenes]|nr:peptidylprolyl isomerase [Streptococcus pyogenes]HEQ4533444.1 peptidylprolyl isomerase [Streptococcus pyogenes]HEQ5192457.1 peptidylprolyl isomerase [Streptococcus pyogenes]HEQ9728233.1 peptidylprolyl isomerase [Streptococcus pyogenes]HEQ9729975.1 peptidylprolyl isomerase [Streptococcus pyogenes]
MKKLLSLSLVAISLLSLSACESVDRAIKGDKYIDEKTAKEESEAASKAYEESIQKALKADASQFPQLTKEVGKEEAKVVMRTSQGDITLKLFPKYAPLAVENFLTHAKKGYYDNLTFHRVINDFMIQSGDPKGDGTGGESIWKGKDPKKDAGNGFVNEISPFLYHIRGALAMANAGANTNGSQFYINQNKKNQSKGLSSINYPKPIISAYEHGGNPSLDGGYTVFGQVIDGMDVVDKIAATSINQNDKPEQDITITSIDIVKDYRFKN